MGHLESSYQPDQGRLHGHGVVVHLSGIDTRTQAEALKRAQILGVTDRAVAVIARWRVLLVSAHWA